MYYNLATEKNKKHINFHIVVDTNELCMQGFMSVKCFVSSIGGAGEPDKL